MIITPKASTKWKLVGSKPKWPTSKGGLNEHMLKTQPWPLSTHEVKRSKPVKASKGKKSSKVKRGVCEVESMKKFMTAQ